MGSEIPADVAAPDVRLARRRQVEAAVDELRRALREEAPTYMTHVETWAKALDHEAPKLKPWPAALRGLARGRPAVMAGAGAEPLASKGFFAMFASELFFVGAFPSWVCRTEGEAGAELERGEVTGHGRKGGRAQNVGGHYDKAVLDPKQDSRQNVINITAVKHRLGFLATGFRPLTGML